jgi:hypothetical protein
LIQIIPKVALVLLSIVSIIGSSGIFAAAILLAMFLMCLSGVISYFGHLKLGLVNLALTSIAFSVSPVADISRMGSALEAIFFLVPVVIGYGGAILGANRIQHASGT